MNGISYPIEIDNGNLKTSQDLDLVRQHVLSWLETFLGERVESNYGIPLYVGVFDSNSNISATILNGLRTNVDAIFERVEVNQINDGVLRIDVYYNSDFLSVDLNGN